MKTFTSELQSNLILLLKDALGHGCKRSSGGWQRCAGPWENPWVLGGLQDFDIQTNPNESHCRAKGCRLWEGELSTGEFTFLLVRFAF